jgi:hypothetical protein
MAASDLTSVAFIYKRDYSGRQAGDIAMRDHVHFTRIAKNGGFVGVGHFYKIRYGNPQGISGTFADAQSGASGSKGKQLQMLRKAKYGVITLDGEAIAASEGDKGAFYNLVTMETDGVLEEMGDSFAFDLYRDGTGQRGRRASASSNVITLTVADDARNFKEGMTVIASANANGSSPRTGSTTVVAVDEDAGTVELASAAAITAFANNDFLFRKGDPGTCMEGLASSTPLTAPVLGADSFRGIDRGSDPRRLAGVRVDDTGTYLEDNLGLLAVKVDQLGKKITEAYANPINVYGVTKRLGAKVEYDDGGGSANHGFQFVMIHSPAGSFRLYADADCPTNRAYVVNQARQYLKHNRGLPHIIMDDGIRSLRSASADSIEARARGWVNYAQDEPGCFGVCSV